MTELHARAILVPFGLFGDELLISLWGGLETRLLTLPETNVFSDGLNTESEGNRKFCCSPETGLFRDETVKF